MAQSQLYFPHEPVGESAAPSQDSLVSPYSATRWAALVTPVTFMFPKFMSGHILYSYASLQLQEYKSSSPPKAQTWLEKMGTEHSDYLPFFNNSLFLADYGDSLC